MALTLEALQVLDAIARKGSFSAAAAELHRVPSAITYTVQRLEEGLGVTLFDRGGHRAVLTDAGRVVLEQGRPLLEAANELEATVRRVATGWEAELRIAVDGIFPLTALYPLLERFYAEQPRVRVRLSREVLAGAWDALLDGRADLVVGATGEGPPGGGYAVRTIGEVPLVPVAAPGLPLCELEGPLEPEDLRPYRVVAVADTARNRPERSAGLQNGQPVLTVPDQEAKVAALLRGLGVAHLPRHAAAPHLESGALRALSLRDPMPPVPTYLAWRTPVRGRALHWFLEALAEEEPLLARLAGNGG
ncbi:LysR substrate-binding domain-containing protein [Thiohalorhabdus sp. Cl-TMA]|uniref:LysR substrate-binding domain-containing protein n=1 Tax=Thiohalorhabdus methylotrophus TaxID=3242694 RepID=A0ABV4TR56_9GAMM